MLRTAGIDVTDEKMLYVDRLTKAAVKARDPASLKEREYLLKPPRPGEAVYLAGLRVLGLTMPDIAHAVAQAWQRQLVVYCVDIDRVFSAETPIAEMIEAIASAEDAHRRAVGQEKAARATAASRKKREERKVRQLAVARPLWHDRSYTVNQIALECGLSRRTLYDALGPRWETEKGAQHV